MTLSEIRKHSPQIQKDDQLEILAEDDLPKEGIVEIFITTVGNFAWKIYRNLKIKNLFYVVIITLSALEGLNIRIPLERELPNIFIEFDDSRQWMDNILKNSSFYTSNQYFQFNYPANPNPEDEVFFHESTTIVAPITASKYFTEYLNQ